MQRVRVSFSLILRAQVMDMAAALVSARREGSNRFQVNLIDAILSLLQTRGGRRRLALEGRRVEARREGLVRVDAVEPVLDVGVYLIILLHAAVCGWPTLLQQALVSSHVAYLSF